MSNLTAKVRRFAVSFSETKVYAQIMATSVLTILVALVFLVPSQALTPFRSAVAWTVSNNYDFSGQWQRARVWASQQGGWNVVARNTWETWIAQVGPWIDLESVGMVNNPVVPVASPRRAPIMPVDGVVLLGFGWTAPGIAEDFHEGLDLAVPADAPVVAVTDGIVMEVRIDDSLGRLIEINHGQVIGIYAHLGTIRVVAGQRVSQGDQIALVSPLSGTETGSSAHLHFEVRTLNGRVPIDPSAYLGLGGRKL